MLRRPMPLDASPSPPTIAEPWEARGGVRPRVSLVRASLGTHHCRQYRQRAARAAHRGG
eukprot:jgi/Botrbrau1/15203/Bobra.0149s0062.1